MRICPELFSASLSALFIFSVQIPFGVSQTKIFCFERIGQGSCHLPVKKRRSVLECAYAIEAQNVRRIEKRQPLDRGQVKNLCGWYRVVQQITNMKLETSYFLPLILCEASGNSIKKNPRTFSGGLKNRLPERYDS